MKNRGLSQEGLKLIACVTMLLDHIGAIVVMACFENAVAANRGLLLDLYEVLRTVGRLAFPIYCFLLAEGAYYTRNPKQYGLRLLIGAILAEIPFDLAFRGTLFDMSFQNVFWTLAFGLAAMMIHNDRYMPGWKRMVGLLVCFFVPYLFHTDYSIYGVLTIFMMNLFYGESVKMCMAGYIILLLQSTTEAWAIFGFLLILLYNGQKGHGSKMFYYLFYPGHLMILVLLKPYIVEYFSGLMSVTFQI